MVAIGCKLHSMEYWNAHYEEIAMANDMSEEDINWYREQIEKLKSFI